ncbi:hypothetical protein ACN38_g11225 [Penicillium nordicum]|uniref:Uncharacterized protein n=1 Tax=Penicillium nordicum TaxID=229535 RepID=A0A0M9WB10_9EURO|nr:hypothetical protein ACN38_g11225 [Penicillium nordicum]
MGLSTGNLTNDLGEGFDLALMAAFKVLKRGGMSGVGEENVHGGCVILEVRSFERGHAAPRKFETTEATVTFLILI